MQFDLGVYYANQRDLPRAIDAFKHSLRINPIFPSAAEDLDVVSKEAAMGSVQNASVALTAAPNASDTSNASPGRQSQSANAMIPQAAASIPDLEAQVSQNPKSPDAHVHLGVVYGLNGESDEAISEYKIAIGLLNPGDPRIPMLQQIIASLAK